jgi:hypothetical protein
MDITSPYFVVSVIVVVFAVAIFFAAGTKEDGSSEH